MRKRDHLTPDEERELLAIDRALAGEPVAAELRELEALVADVRATAPQMSPGFAARLERDAREGFPTPEQAPRAVPGRGRRWIALPAAGTLAAVVVALVVVLGGGSESGTPTRAPGGGSGAQSAVPAPGAPANAPEKVAPGAEDADTSRGAGADLATAPPAAAAGGATSVLPAPAPVLPATGAPRKVQLSASLAIETPAGDFDAADGRVATIVADAGGIVAGARTSTRDGRSEGSYDLRIPAGRLDRTLAVLAKIGRVTERDRSLDDITASFDSVQTRLTDARAERRGLLRTLERATTQGQIDSTKARLRAVGGRIAALERQRSSLRRRADLATVDLTIRSSGERGAGVGARWSPGDAARDALRVLEVLAGVALVGLAVLVPVGLVGGGLALGLRAGRRRRRETALDPA